ncbi:MAG: hypothetical protein ACMUHM_05650 [Thermoplasmatota archaeon]
MRVEQFFFVSTIISILLCSGCLRSDDDTVKEDNTNLLRRSAVLLPLNGSGKFPGEGSMAGTAAVHQNDEYDCRIQGTDMGFYAHAEFWDFYSDTVLSDAVLIQNATLQMEYSTWFVRDDLLAQFVKDFHWGIGGINHSIEWTPRITQNDTVDNITLFSDRNFTLKDLSSFSLYLTIRSRGWIAPSLDLDRVWVVIDYLDTPGSKN